MALRINQLVTRPQSGNVTGAERWVSGLAGVGLMAAAMRGNAVGRVVKGVLGASLLSRATTGYCAMKGALAGETKLKDGFKQQWQRLAGRTQSGAGSIDSMDALYLSELQELYSAEQQLQALASRLAQCVAHESLRQRFRDYAQELQVRLTTLEQHIIEAGGTARAHPDQAMQALIAEAYKMSTISDPKVRDAALVASLQRIIHYKIAGYGSVAAYAKVLGKIDEAARFALESDREKAIDAEFTEFAKATLNPEATQTPWQPPMSEIRTH